MLWGIAIERGQICFMLRVADSGQIRSIEKSEGEASLLKFPFLILLVNEYISKFEEETL
jgi:hypothetical protein